MSRFKPALAAAAIGLFSCVASHAQDYIFGFSQGSDSAALSLNTTQGEIAIQASDQGWWSPDAVNGSYNSNWITGDYFGTLWNDYFVFDTVDALNGATVLSGSISIQDPADYGSPPYPLTLWDVTTPIDVLETNASPNVAVYEDLGSGILYGSLSYDGGGVATVDLDAAAISAINGNSSEFAIGGTINDVPDGASSAALLGLALIGLAGWRRRPVVGRFARGEAAGTPLLQGPTAPLP